MHANTISEIETISIHIHTGKTKTISMPQPIQPAIKPNVLNLNILLKGHLNLPNSIPHTYYFLYISILCSIEIIPYYNMLNIIKVLIYITQKTLSFITGFQSSIVILVERFYILLYIILFDNKNFTISYFNGAFIIYHFVGYSYWLTKIYICIIQLKFQPTGY